MAASLFSRGAIILASVIPADTMTKPVISIAPKKLYPVCSISNKTIGRIAAWYTPPIIAGQMSKPARAPAKTGLMAIAASMSVRIPFPIHNVIGANTK